MAVRKPTCLVADDHAVVREVLLMRLADMGTLQIVGEVSNGAEAIRTIRELVPDIALVDLRMPAASGIDVAAAVAHDGLATRVIIVSACVEAGVVESARAAGAHGYVAKDASSACLAQAVQRVLEGAAFVDASDGGVRA